MWGYYAAAVHPRLADVVGWLELRADPGLAEDWDRVGLVCGDPAAPVSSVLFAVDPAPAVVAYAIEQGHDLLVTHHPLLLRGVHSVAETTSRGRSVSALVRAGCGLLTMHTNADAAAGGVNDALADALGMTDQREPIRAQQEEAPHRLVVYVPVGAADGLIDALAEAGAGRLGDYDSCAFWADGTGQFRPLSGADPHIGAVGRTEHVAERRVEMVFPPALTGRVVAALRTAHPYEEPAFSVVPSAALPGSQGLGRVGEIPPAPLRAVAQRLSAALPPFGSLVRVAGDPERIVRRVAVCGGAGDSLLADVAASDVDLYVTSDLRHHPATDFVAESDVALMDIPHASGESLWLRSWAEQLQADAAAAGMPLAAAVAPVNTDPWTFHVASQE